MSKKNTMVLIINTTAKNGQLLLNIYDSNEALLLNLKDTDHGTCLLMPGQIYRIAWQIWSKQAAVYRIETEVEPQSSGIPDFKFFKSYPTGASDKDETYITT
jgi:hypothetical protein